MKSSALLKNPVEVRNRLNQLGWRREDLLEVVDAMVAARNSCTENDPPGSPGWSAWKDGTRRLREIGSLNGCLRNDDNHIPSIYDAPRGIKIAVCNTDEGTGMEDAYPQQRSKKGPATIAVVASNQGIFADLLRDAVNVIQLTAEDEGVLYWYLCVFSEGDVVRAELSCPSKCDGGFFTAFRERIILLGDDGDEKVRARRESPDDDSGFEISVTRKRA